MYKGNSSTLVMTWLTCNNIKDGSRKHAKPWASDIRAQVHRCQPVEIIRQCQWKQRAQSQESDNLEAVLANCFVYCLEFVVLFCQLTYLYHTTLDIHRYTSQPKPKQLLCWNQIVILNIVFCIVACRYRGPYLRQTWGDNAKQHLSSTSWPICADWQHYESRW